MQRSSTKLNKSEKLFLNSVMEHGNKTDSKIASEIGISKSSVSRIRKRMVDERILTDCISVVDLEKFGISFYCLLIFQWRGYPDEATKKQMVENFTTTPQVVYFAEGEGPTTNHVAMIAFTDFDDYNQFFDEFKKEYGALLGEITVFFVQPKKILKQDYTSLVKMLISR